jgi:hypothetical protein
VGDNREPVRNIRIANDLWKAAQRAVLKRGDPSVTHIIRVALRQYVDETDRQVRRRSSAVHKQGEPPAAPSQRSEPK